MDSIMGTKKKKKADAEKKKNELIQIRIEVAKPGSKKYTHVDWEELMKSHGHNKDEDALRRFYDEDTLFMAKKLSETKSKSGKQIRVNLDYIQHLNRNCGYDMDDDFIDDTEAVDDMNIVSKKGGFYVGKGAVKAMDEEEEEEESEEEELEVQQRKPRQKHQHKHKEKEKASAQDSSSDSDSSVEPVRMTGAPPTARMTGAPPSKRLLSKRPSPPVVQRKDSSPPPRDSSVEVVVPEKKKKAELSPTKAVACTSSSSETVEEDVAQEPPAKKKLPDFPPVAATVSNASTTSVASTSSSSSVKIITPPSTSPQKPGSSSTQPQSSTKGSALTMMAKKIVKDEELSKKASPQKEIPANVTAVLTNMYSALTLKGKAFKEKPGNKLDRSSIKDILEFINIAKHHKIDKGSIENLTTSIAKSFGLTIEEMGRQLLEEAQPAASSVQIKKEMVDPSEWRLTQADIPHMSQSEIIHVTTIVKSWKSKKDISTDVLSRWLKDVNQARMNVDNARLKLFDYVNILPDLDKPVQDSGLEIPKHERSRKARMFLHQWVYLSRKYIEMILPTLKKPPTDGYAKKQVIAANALKEAVKKQMMAFEMKKDKPLDAAYTFQFTEPVLAAVFTYLDELVDYSLSIGKLDIIVHGIDSLHQALDNKIPLIQFYIEICRRIQKLSFLTVEEPMKSRLEEAKEHISKHQVVQNIKYQIKWPGGVEPSMRGLTRELQDFKTSVLANWKPPTPATLRPSTSSAPTANGRPIASTPTVSSAPGPSSSNPSSATNNSKQPSVRQPTEEERRAMNTIVQVYLGKYLLATGSCSTADICDPSIVPLSDEMLVSMITAVYVCGATPMNQMLMLKNVLAHVGQSRMAQAIASQKTDNMNRLATKDYQAIFEYFGKYEKAMERKRAMQAEIEDRERRKTEERLKKERKEAEREQKEREKQAEKEQKEREKQAEKEKKEREKQVEREKKEREKAEERERKEREKREERERKEREAREANEQRRREEEDRRAALEMLRRQAEEARRKREAEELAQIDAEQRARMETEAAAASQGLEEDLLMDDAEFITEQQSRVDQERSIVELKRAMERENQIKLMRAQQLQKFGQQKVEAPEQSEQTALEWMESIDAARRAKLHNTISLVASSAQAPPPPQESAVFQQNHVPVTEERQQQPQDVFVQHPQQIQPSQPQSQQQQQLEQQQPQFPEPNHYNNGGSDDIQWIDNRNVQNVDNQNVNQNQHHMPIAIPEVKNEIDILNAAQEAAGLPTTDVQQETYYNGQDHVHNQNQNSFAPPHPAPAPLAPPSPAPVPAPAPPAEKPKSAFDKLASLRGRTLSADVKRLSEAGSEQQQQQQMMLQQQQTMYQNGAPSTPFSAPGASNQQRFFAEQQDLGMIAAQNHQNQQQHHQQHQQQQQQQQMMLQEQQMRIKHMQMQQQMLHNQNQNQNVNMQNSYFNGNMENNRRTMSMSVHPQQVQVSQQLPAYQSPGHHNSSLMHTPMSNGSSMLSQSPQFSAHPSPMSQQFHTPPSVGMVQQMNMMNSPMNANQNQMSLNVNQQQQQQQQQPLQHFNFPSQFTQQQQQQMHRQISQQHQMQHQQSHPMMRQMSQHHNYPPH